MAALRHNLSRRALLGAGVGACAVGGGDMYSLRVPLAEAAAEAGGAGQGDGGHGQVHVPDAAVRRRWTRTLLAYRRAEARVASFKAEEALLPPERREWPAVRALEERFGDLDSLRLAALRRLLRIPAPDLAALSLKLDLAVADQAWELTGCDTCLEAIAADARRLAALQSSPDRILLSPKRR